MHKIAILYICTGKYACFWEDFYKSAEKNFLGNSHKEYFVFTDKKIEVFNNRVHRIKQKKLGWPYDTLLRFKMFSSIQTKLRDFDYIFFLNANAQFIEAVTEDILPNNDEKLLAVQHPGFYDKKRAEYTYESNPRSLAFISANEGQNYYMGGFNGGIAKEYIKLVVQLNFAVEEDLKKGIIAVWHDESHLNKYLLNYEGLKILNPSYGFPEGWNLPFTPKILILNKDKVGGHDWLRKDKKLFINKLILRFKHGIS